ncbi:DUF6314 family protein [Myceligenerans xiligouense]|uniref:DUF6314 domain-containing protein n=1 Tax=Myceligenerans xiligouense TaxID=253184 RepID=A0A3N4YP41_9MICO|nr:DUF6314 family protein [Myceligenerans xiligouense]RPF21134.1 hypothetical protein EDD34_1753 [Myceligenerans xiligouense]
MDPSQLVGVWEFRREVRDRLDDTEYAADGTATFTPEGDGRIRWAEEGTLRWADRSTPVSRTLFLVRGSAAPEASDDETSSDGSAPQDDDAAMVAPAPAVPVTRSASTGPGRDHVPGDDDATGAAAGDWRVTFEDGRDFHPWTALPVEHACGRDLYEGRVTPGSRTPNARPDAGAAGPVTGPARPANDPARLATGRTSTADGDPLSGTPTWSIRWRVTGPAKDYTMVTRYSRRG